MTCFPWKWEAFCITSASREPFKSFDSTTLSLTACVVARLMRCNQLRTILLLDLKDFCVIYTPVCSVYQQNNISLAEISQWTNHRVMEWLRSVDLAEYAPNLRGSGVHGGLMVRRPSRQSLRGTETPSWMQPHKQESLLCRCWSRGSMWRRWLCCWTFPPTRRCCAATWPHTSACSSVLRRSRANRSVWKTQTTSCSLQPPRSR